MSKLKVLIIRLNSIGDIVLTSSVIRALDLQGYEVHYLSKGAYKSLLINNPRVTKHIALDSNMSNTIDQLKNEQYSYVVDLHNNYRSKKICRSLFKNTFTLKKNSLRLFIMTKFHLAYQQQDHIVDRFMNTVEPLLSEYEKPKVEFHIPNDSKQKVELLDLPDNYISISIGAAHVTKRIPIQILDAVIEAIEIPFVLLGGKEDIATSNILEQSHPNMVHNYCGKLSIEESAAVLSRSLVLLTGDTGLMHIAAALDISVVAIYSSTHPILGYTPYYNDMPKSVIVQNAELNCRPCTKQGRRACPKGHYNCMNKLDIGMIIEKMRSFI